MLSVASIGVMSYLWGFISEKIHGCRAVASGDVEATSQIKSLNDINKHL